MFQRKHVKIVKYHRNSTVYIDGRYLCVDTKISTRSKNGRQIARETVQAILEIVGSSEPAFDVIQNDRTVADPPAPAGFEDGKSGLRTAVQDSPKPPDSFSEEEGKEAVRRVTDE